MKRVRIGLVMVATGLVLSMMMAQGCGGSEAPVDSGVADTSVADTSLPDTSTPPKDAGKDTAPTCDTKIDPFMNVPDAAVGDAGMSTGQCAACMKTKCKSEIDACMGDCTCQGPIITVLECVLKLGGITQPGIIQCASGLAAAPPSVQSNGFAIAGCLQTKCAAECIPPDLDGGSDASRDGARD